tara:strand:+ start:182 stop:805 length:624 start_codon:yes stop_codon:yes gene_type:complete
MKKNKFILILSLFLLFNSSLFGTEIWRSFIIPGWGEKQLNHDKRGNMLLFTELALWTAFTYSNNQYSSYKNSYIIHGKYFAGVEWKNKNDVYAANVGNYTCLLEDDCGNEAYNVIIRQQTIGNDIGYPEIEEYRWNWESRDERLKYDTWRNKSKNYGDMKGFIIGGMIINRIISVIDVIILERKNILTSELYQNSNNDTMLKIFYNF